MVDDVIVDMVFAVLVIASIILMNKKVRGQCEAVWSKLESGVGNKYYSL